jgi:hypothetical protein
MIVVSFGPVGTVNGVAHSKESDCELEPNTPVGTFIWIRVHNKVKNVLAHPSLTYYQKGLHDW